MSDASEEMSIARDRPARWHRLQNEERDPADGIVAPEVQAMAEHGDQRAWNIDRPISDRTH
jgi:hypothetical protein